jgi:malonyl-CoA O-methyltransferase
LSPEAALAGHRRTFHDAAGIMHEVEHFAHTVSAHARAAERAGLSLIGHREGVVGESIKQFYTDAGRLRAYDEQRGLPVVLGLAWRKLPH